MFLTRCVSVFRAHYNGNGNSRPHGHTQYKEIESIAFIVHELSQPQLKHLNVRICIQKLKQKCVCVYAVKQQKTTNDKNNRSNDLLLCWRRWHTVLRPINECKYTSCGSVTADYLSNSFAFFLTQSNELIQKWWANRKERAKLTHKKKW